MARHLSEPFLTAALNLGKHVGQLLSVRRVAERWDIRYVSLWRDAEGYVVALHEVWTERPEDPGDVTEMPSLDGDVPDGEGRRSRFETLEAALGWVESELGGNRTRFVNAGIIQDEVEEALARAR